MKEAEYIRRAEVLKVRLYRTARLYLGGEHAALDAVDEAVYKGLLACGKLREPAYFDTWLTRILINVCNSELRRRKRERTMEELPETAVEAFDALPLREAARALELPAGTVSTRQRRALELLRLELSEQEV